MNFKQTVKLSHIEGGLYALMLASTESFLFYYAVKQNATPMQLGLLNTFPFFMGALAQMFLPKLIAEKNLGNSVVWTMMLQIIGVIGILHTVMVHYDFNYLMFFCCIHFIGGLTSTPLWIDWASRIIPKRNFRKYMAGRSSYTWYLILVFYVSLALLAQYTSWFKLIYVFIIGAIARILSCTLQIVIVRGEYSQKIKKLALSKKQMNQHQESKHELSADLKKTIWTFIFWTALFRFAIQVSGPFFVPYMVNDLKLSMAHFVILSSIPYFGRALFFNRWGRAGKSHGAFYGVHLSMLYLSLVPIIWTLSRDYYFLVFSEILGGAAWGGFELNQVLMIQNFMHQSMKMGSRVLIGIHMSLTNFFGVLGAIVGSVLLERQWPVFHVFYLSAFLRFSIALILVLKASSLDKNEFNAKSFRGYLRNFLPLRY